MWIYCNTVYCDTVPVSLISLQIQEFVGSSHKQILGCFFVAGSFGLLRRRLSKGSHGQSAQEGA